MHLLTHASTTRRSSDLWPISVDSFRWEAHYHFRDAPRTWREKFALESSIAFNRDISSEDTACTQQQQVAMKSGVRAVVQFGVRSEEHTSELQSLMRISYAVFCLKKKKRI